MASHLKEAAYVTGHFGKYINAHSKSRSVPPYWDRWCERLGDGSDTVGDATTLNRANVDGDITDPLPGILSVWSVERCADFARARASSPWCAQYCPTIPHCPYAPSASSEHLYDGAKRHAPSVNEADMSDKPKWMRVLPRIKAQAEFEGKKEEPADLDRYGLRPILAALEATSQLANSVIFFTSDNGYLHGEHHLRARDKPYWECSEVPFFVKGPGVKSGVTRTALVNHTDLKPTTCAIAGISPSSLDVDGRSMLTHLGRRTFSGWRKRMLVSGSDDAGPEMRLQ